MGSISLISFGGLFGNVQNNFPSFVFISRGYVYISCLISFLKYLKNTLTASSMQSSNFFGLCLIILATVVFYFPCRELRSFESMIFFNAFGFSVNIFPNMSLLHSIQWVKSSGNIFNVQWGIWAYSSGSAWLP